MDSIVIFSAFLNPLLWAVLSGFVLHYVKQRAVETADAVLFEAELASDMYSIPAVAYLVARPGLHVLWAFDSVSAWIYERMWDAGEILASLGLPVFACLASLGGGTALFLLQPDAAWSLQAGARTTVYLADTTLHALAEWDIPRVCVVVLGLLLLRYKIRVLLNKDATGDGASMALAVLDWVVCGITGCVFPLAPLYVSWGPWWVLGFLLGVLGLIGLGHRDIRNKSLFPGAYEYSEPVSPGEIPSRRDSASRGGSGRRRKRKKKRNPHAKWFAVLAALCIVVLIIQSYAIRMVATVVAIIVVLLVVSKVLARLALGPSASWSLAFHILCSSRVGSGLAWAGHSLWASVRRLSPAPLVEATGLAVSGMVVADKAAIGALRAQANVLVTTLLVVTFVVVAIASATFLLYQLHAESLVLVSKFQAVWSAFVNAPAIQKLWFASVDARDAVAMNDSFTLAYTKVHTMARNWTQEKLEDIFGTDVNMTLLETQAKHVWEMYAPGELEGPDPVPLSLGSVAEMVKRAWNLEWVAKLQVSQMTSMGMTALSSVGQALTSLSVLFSFVIWISFATVDVAVSFVVFSSALGYFLVSDSFRPLEMVTSFLPTTQVQNKLREDIKDTLNQVFLASILLACYHFFLVWATFEAVGADVVYVPALLSAVMAVIPKFPSFLIVLPFALEMWIVQLRPTAALVGIFLPHLGAWWFVDTAIQASIRRSHPYVSSLAMVGGLTHFGLSGAILGPLLVSLLMIAFNVMSAHASFAAEGYRDDHDHHHVHITTPHHRGGDHRGGDHRGSDHRGGEEEDDDLRRTVLRNLASPIHRVLDDSVGEEVEVGLHRGGGAGGSGSDDEWVNE